ncbi:phosphatidylserine/phosphatidylglycerophosphate/cardiolipin synthase family protein [bacterium]|nr:phosphatidylserine/phosphatidylglycerophosphate/cardiolipin synthase family protein [bacterium]
MASTRFQPVSALLACTLLLGLVGCAAPGAQPSSLSARSQEDANWKSLAQTSAAEAFGELDRTRKGKLSSADAGFAGDELKQFDQDRDGMLSQLEAVAFAMRLTDALRDTTTEPPLQTKPANPALPLLNDFNPTAQANEAELLVDADQIYPAMLAAIRDAKRSVQMDYYLLGGAIGDQFADALIAKAREGVQVRVMLDGWAANQGGPTGAQLKPVIKRLQEAGVDQRFYPIEWLPRNPGWLANRFLIDHNKLLVLDRESAFVGSMNLFDMAVMNHDLMVKLRGPMAQELGGMMDEEWPTPRALPAPVAVTPGPNTSLIRGTKTSVRERSTKDMLLQNMAQARKSVYMAIFDFSDLEVVDGLIAAHRRGLDVRVLVDRHNTNEKYVPLAHYVNIYGMPNLSPVSRLVQAKVPVKWFDPVQRDSELHMKMTVLDGNKAMLGSTNYTYQAFNNFRETGIEISGGRTVEQLTTMFEADWQGRGTAATSLTFKERVVAKVSDYMERKRLGWW